jgi:hypothetical protein
LAAKWDQVYSYSFHCFLCRYLTDHIGFERIVGVSLLLCGVAYQFVGPAPPVDGAMQHPLPLILGAIMLVGFAFEGLWIPILSALLACGRRILGPAASHAGVHGSSNMPQKTEGICVRIALWH